MPKAVKYSPVAREMKKEYLKEHLETIKALIGSWMAELYAPEPLTPSSGIWGWQSVYSPPEENYPDNNHMLRRHLRSRALWSHHSSWQRKLESIWHLTEQVRAEAEAKHKQLSDNKQWQYTAEYTKVALWKAFDVAFGKGIDEWYKEPDEQVGLAYGAYKIEVSATSSEERSSIQAEHRELVSFLSQLTTMKQLVELWGGVEELQSQMGAIASKALKSGDIFYVCMFCKHLWT